MENKVVHLSLCISKEYGLEKPVRIQQQAIPAFLKGKNLLIRSLSESERALSYVIPALQMIEAQKAHSQSLILACTRESVTQITNNFKSIAKYLEISIVTIFQEPLATETTDALKEKPQILLGTPGGTLEVLKKGYFRTDNLRMVIIDEADEIIRRGFRSQLEDILQQIPKEAKVYLKA